MSAESYTAFIKQEAARLGFEHCGVSKAEFLENEAPRFEKWLHQDMHGKMDYMANYMDMRLDPRLLVPGAKSVISLMLNYYPEEKQNEGAPHVSKYAYGRDYHKVIKSKLKEFMRNMKAHIGDVNGRAFVDSAPVLERAWATKSGLGWIGKNSLLIRPGKGSFFFLAELIVDLELEYDGPIKDYCGSCTRCIDACPTQAIVEPNIVDGSKCISYFTIELKEAIPQEMKGKFENWMFGCDVCQDVCPWNRFSKPHQTEELKANPDLLQMNEKDFEEITEDIFDKKFHDSPFQRTGYEGIKRNLRFIKP
ncbi:MAG TPA: tRNA epoxyqueuosine(34) reductase QueG [Bacteroidia bacterium]|jgi:epoxyqueuosine reductase|nr:tRNA epoxyqueuosine(34) reductase QueG [Bacteroidia bacterium]